MENDLYQMQQEAARRVQSMQERARTVSANQPSAPSPPERIPSERTPSERTPSERTPSEPDTANPPNKGLLQMLVGEKSDNLLILVLLVLLTEDGAEPSLLLAMLYLFL